ncbi:hypothetical protein OROHE_015536 [Orobanche hederae]
MRPNKKPRTSYMKFRGSRNLRMRLLLSTLSLKPIQVDDIRADAAIPGLRPHEISFILLLQNISDGSNVVINETGTRLRYEPGIIIGGKRPTHNCGLSRSMGYFLEPLIVLALFGKDALSIKLTGITNDSRDISVDTFKSTTLPLLKRFGVDPQGLDLKILSRGVAPNGGGEVLLTVPNLRDSLKAVVWTDEGMVKRIRGVTFSTKVSVQFENKMIHAARGIFNRLLPDVHIFTDHKAGPLSGNSPGYGISVVAETTSGCFISADTTVSSRREDEDDYMVVDEGKRHLIPADDVGEQTACVLLGEIEQGGVVDSSHQGLLFLLCALCPRDVSKVRVGKLTPHGIEVLGHIQEFLDAKFKIKPDLSTDTVILKCVGCGLRNLSRKLS